MSLDTISKMMSLQSSSNNLQLQQMSVMSKNLSLIETMKDMKEDKRTEVGRRVYGDLKRNNDIVAEMKKINYDALSPEQQVAITEGMQYHDDASVSMFLHLNDPAAAAFTPPTGENGTKVRDTNLQFSQTLLGDAGAPVDQLQYMGEVSANMEAAAKGGELSGLTYDSLPGLTHGIIREFVPGFEPQDVSTAPEDMEDRMKMFRAVAVNKFKKEFENDPDIDTIARLEGAVKETIKAMNIDVEGAPDTANALVFSGMEAITQYRESQGTTNMANLEGLVGQNLVNSRDILNKIGYENASLTPSALIEKLNKNLGFRQLRIISEGASIQGDGDLLLSNLAKKMKDLNPLIDDDSVSESERKSIFKRAFLDVMAAGIAKSSSNVAPAERISVIKQIQQIDSDIDQGTVEPMVNDMLEHAYTRYTEGFSTYNGDERRRQSAAKAAGRGFIIDATTGKTVQTTTDFTQVAENARGNTNTAVAKHYDKKMNEISYGAGYDLVKAAADNGEGVLGVTEQNKQFYLGQIGANAISPGLSAIADGVVRDLPIEQIAPAFANPEARVHAEFIRKNSALVSMQDPKLLVGLFMPKGKDNPIDMAGLELEDDNGYYLPESVGKMINENPTLEMSNLIKAAKISPLGAKAIMTVGLHAYAMQAQSAADVYNDSMTSMATSLYPDAAPDSTGHQRKFFNVAMTDEMETFENDVPFLLDSIETTTLGGQDIDNLVKYREALEIRIHQLNQTKKNADATVAPDQKAMFLNTQAENLGKNFDLTVSTLTELAEVIDEFETYPSHRFTAYGEAFEENIEEGEIAMGHTARERIKDKRKELSARLDKVLSVMNQASL